MRSRLVLGLALVLAACSGGGGGSGTTTPPSAPWGNFRQANNNSAAASLINTNTGAVSLPIPLDGVTLSTPTVDRDGNVLIGTKHGVQAFAPGCFVYPPNPAPTPTGQCPLWTFTECSLPCTSRSCPFPTPIPVGSVTASPTVNGGGAVVVGTDGSDSLPGRVFAFQEEGDTVTCLWTYPPPGSEPFPTRSSAATLPNSDNTLSVVYIGGDDGTLLALNADGTVRWKYPTVGSVGSISSSPALDENDNVYVTSEDGTVSARNFGGGQVWPPVSIGAAGDQPFQPSAAVSTSIYAIGSGSTIYAINPNGTKKWTPPFTLPRPPSGSPAFLPENFDVGASLVTDTIVYVVDTQGTAYGLRDLNGTIVPLQRCSLDVTQECMMNNRATT